MPILITIDTDKINAGDQMKSLILLLVGFIFVTNSLTQWMQITSAPQNFIQNITEVNNILYLSHSFSGVYKSTDGALTWQQISNGLNTGHSKTVYEIISYNGNLYAATADGIYKSTNLGDEWIKKSNGITIEPGVIYEYTISVFEHNGNLLTGAWNGIYLSADEGENWVVTNATGQHILAKNFTAHNGLLFSARDPGNQPNGYKSSDNGLTWEPLASMPVPSISFFSETGKLWAGTIHAVWLSTDSGNSWDLRENGFPPDPYNSSVIRVNGVLMTSLPTGGPGVFISTNEGLLWEGFGQGLSPTNNIMKLIIYNDKIIAATSQGLWKRNVNEVIPVELSSFTASVSGSDVVLNWSTATETNNLGFEVERQRTEWEKVGFITGYGTTTEPGYYSYRDKNLSSGVYQYRLKQIDFDGTFEFSNEIEVEVYAPNEFSLEQNYPNPFNPTTKIKYQISEAGFVRLNIYDVLGNEVAILINEEKPAGNYEVRFDASKLSSGIYFYTLKAGNFIKTNKMILLR